VNDGETIFAAQTESQAKKWLELFEEIQELGRLSLRKSVASELSQQ
jgi:hypothetical protein